MKLLTASFLVFFAPAVALAQTAGTDSSAAVSERQIRQLEEEYVTAREHADSAALSRMMAPEFVSVASTGRVESRGYLLAHAGVAPSGQRITKMVIDSVNVRMIDPTSAVVIGHRVVTTSDTGGLRFLHVLAKRNGRWQFVAASATSIK